MHGSPKHCRHTQILNTWLIIRCEVHDMDSGVDFRLLTTESSQMYVVTGGTPEGVEKARTTLCKM